MNDINEHVLNTLKLRFVNDMKLPIIIFEEPDFDYFLDLYETQFGSRTKWNKLIDTIDNKFEGNPNLFLEEYSRVRNTMIDSIENNEYYKEFVDSNNKLSQYDIPTLDYPSSNVYKETNNGDYFLSIDLKKANFSALMYHDSRILGEEKPVSYDEWVSKFTDLDYIKESKYTRQVVFGKVNPKRQIKVEKYMIHQALLAYQELFVSLNIEAKVVSFCTDEVVFDVSNNFQRYVYDHMYAIKHLQKRLMEDYGINVDVEYYKLELHKFKTYRGAEIPVYLKKYIEKEQNYDLFSVPSFYYAQIYKLIHGQELNEADMKFYMEGQIAKFYHPLTYINKTI